ncbi:MAG: DUF2793 domain-containing protein [Alphaproteobacteria bacterium]|nr:DUF2793 domain-containing protein [Alphaproteobacteria bacterium]MDZ4762512.1 DUF2793 domain-containing protein [Alphaproteobacteria bacterium]
MTDISAQLQLPYLAAGQAQKHVTVNDSLRRLDAIVQLSVVSSTTIAQPASPVDGSVYIVPAGKTGTQWATFANWALGYYRDGAWEQITPREGWRAFVKDTDQLVYYTGSAWSLFPVGKLVTVSATDKVLGRATAGAGAAEEIALTAAGRALIDAADATAQRATLGLGSAALKNTGSSGDAVPLLDQSNEWGGDQVYRGYRIVLLPAAAGSGSTGIRLRTFAGEGKFDFGYDEASDGFFLNRFSGGSYADSPLLISGATGAITHKGNAVFHAGASPAPAADNTYNLGSASFRFGTVYAATGTINTSDAREKTALEPIPEAALRAVRRILAGVGVFQWREAVARKGHDPARGGARLHVGVTAQAVRDAFLAEGEDPERWALFCEDKIAGPDGEGTRQGLRTDQLMMLALAAQAEPRGAVAC